MLVDDPFQGRLNRLVPDDCHSFRLYADQRSPCYANGWLYHLRAARNEYGSLGFRCHGDEFFVTFGLRKSFAACVSPMGQNRFAQTPQLCETICKTTGLPVLLKKVDAELHTYLLRQKGFEICDEERFLEDEAYPEHYLDLKELFDEQCQLSCKAKQLQRRVRQFDAQSIKLFAAEHSDSEPGHLVKALNRLVSEDSSKHQAYIQLCRFVQTTDNQNGLFFQKVFVDKRNQIHGLYIAERLSDRTAGLYCAVTSRVYSYATERMDVAFFQWLREVGIQKLMLGGSETAGVHRYVQKFLPIQLETSLRPLVYHVPTRG